ncbi:MAG: MarR family transcriptional regulator [Euryarchaeota archaeon]|nr:MarR family transcriptional regulator [Euryarchaeota archaeon]
MKPLLFAIVLAVAASGCLADGSWPWSQEEPIRVTDCQGAPPTGDRVRSGDARIDYVFRSNRTATFRACVLTKDGGRVWDASGTIQANTEQRISSTSLLPGPFVSYLEITPPDHGTAGSIIHLDLTDCESGVYGHHTEALFEGNRIRGRSLPGGGCRAAADTAGVLGPSDRLGAAPAGSGTAGRSGAIVASGLVVIVLGIGLRRSPGFRFLLVGLFTRLVRPRILEQDVRARIHQLVEAEPGIHGHAIASRLEVGASQATYHLHVLVREGVLVRAGSFRTRGYFPKGRYGPAQMNAMTALRNRSMRRLFDEVRRRPGLSLGEAAAGIGLSVPRTSKIAKRLDAAGLVARERSERRVRLRPTAAGTRV